MKRACSAASGTIAGRSIASSARSQSRALRAPSAANTPHGVPAGIRRAISAAVSSRIETNGIPTAARISASQACAVLQAMTRKSAPAASSLRAMATSVGAGEGPLPSSASLRFGTLGLQSTRRCRWSWSRAASLTAKIFCSRSTVAAGPMPPRMPTTSSASRLMPPPPRRARSRPRLCRRPHRRCRRPRGLSARRPPRAVVNPRPRFYRSSRTLSPDFHPRSAQPWPSSSSSSTRWSSTSSRCCA